MTEPGDVDAAKARELRECAAALRRLIATERALLDPALEIATKAGVWQGPFAASSVAAMRADQHTFRVVADDMEKTARSWDASAAMHEQSAAAAKKALARINAQGH